MKTFIKVITLLVLFIAVRVDAQQATWEFLMPTPQDDYARDIIEESDGSIYVAGRSRKLDQPYKSQALLIKLNHHGVFLDSIQFNFEGHNTLISQLLKSIDDQIILLSLFHEASAHGNNGGLLLNYVDNELNISQSTTFVADSNYRILSANGNVSNEGHLFLSISGHLSGALFHSYLIETNNDFDILKSRFLNTAPSSYFQLRKLDNNNYWAINELTNKYEIFDSQFNRIQEQIIPEYLTSSFGVKWESDSSFFLLGDKSNDYHSLGFINQHYPIDTANYYYNKWQTSDTLNAPANLNGIDFKNKDSLFIGGTHNMPYVLDPYHYPSPSWFVILQTDSLLNIRWERLYGGDANYVMSRIIATRDGGCLVAGTRFDYQNNETQTDIIVLKLNSEGLLVSQNELQESLLREAIVYPNPGSEAIQIRLAVQHPKALLELFDSQGKLVLSQQLYEKESRINTEQLPPGTYIYRLSAATGLNENGKWVKR
ncbi:MAG: T9SS type A sorting domain-containing protein [Bacteroidales bacterium]|nr:T9SS type A sorting domain-containing protein [Bacteroidales bacterium]